MEASESKKKELSLLEGFMTRKLRWFVESDSPSVVRAELAKLRRGVGHAPGDMPELWGMLMRDTPAPLMGAGKEPTYSEWAIYTVLTLFALHQQGREPKKEPMHKAGERLGVAMRKLAKTDDDSEERVKRRFDAMATSDGMDELAHHMRGIVQLLKAGGIPLDYARLANDLFWYQIPGRAASVRLQWGRDYYYYADSEADDKADAPDANPDDGDHRPDEREDESNE